MVAENLNRARFPLQRHFEHSLCFPSAKASSVRAAESPSSIKPSSGKHASVHKYFAFTRFASVSLFLPLGFFASQDAPSATGTASRAYAAKA